LGTTKEGKANFTWEFGIAPWEDRLFYPWLKMGLEYKLEVRRKKQMF
jgi:hypothetical protein